MLKCSTCALNKGKTGAPVQCERYEGYSATDLDYYCTANGTYQPTAEKPTPAPMGGEGRNRVPWYWDLKRR